MNDKAGFPERLASVITGTQKDFAERAGLPETKISQYLNGRAFPQRRTARKLAAAGTPPVNVEWLLTGKGPTCGPRLSVVGRGAAGVGLAKEEPGDEDLITRRIEQLEAVGGVDHEMTRELLLVTARRVRELEREIAELLRVKHEHGPAAGEAKEGQG